MPFSSAAFADADTTSTVLFSVSAATNRRNRLDGIVTLEGQMTEGRSTTLKWSAERIRNTDYHPFHLAPDSHLINAGEAESTETRWISEGGMIDQVKSVQTIYTVKHF